MVNTGLTAHHLFDWRLRFVKVAAILGVIHHSNRPYFSQEPESLTLRPRWRATFGGQVGAPLSRLYQRL